MLELKVIIILFKKRSDLLVFVIPGQGVSPQTPISVEGPLHVFPPFLGEGSLHSLVLFLVPPPPHVLLQGPNWDQLEYDPLTGKLNVMHLF